MDGTTCIAITVLMIKINYGTFHTSRSMCPKWSTAIRFIYSLP